MNRRSVLWLSLGAAALAASLVGCAAKTPEVEVSEPAQPEPQPVQPLPTLELKEPEPPPTAAFDSLYEAREFLAAAEAYEAEPTMQSYPRVLYRYALLHALPSSERYDPQRAVDELNLLVELHPTTLYRDSALLITELLREVQQARVAVTGLEQQLEKLKAIDLEDPP